MDEERRKICAGIGSMSVVAFAGCLGFGTDEQQPPDPERDSKSNTTQNKTTNATDTDDKTEENTINVNELALDNVGEQTFPIIDKMKWLNSEYSSSRQKYKERISFVIDEINSVISNIEETGDVTSEDIRTIRITFEDNLFGIGDELFGKVFTNHYDFESAYEFYSDNFQQYIDANEVDLLKSDLNELEARLRNQLSRSEIDKRYRSTMIFGEFYSDIIPNPQETPRRIIELRSTYPRTRDRLLLPPFDAIGPQKRSDLSLNPQQYNTEPQFNQELDNSFISESSTFSFSSDRVSENYLRLTEYNGDEQFNLKEFESNNVYIQEYADVDAAEEAYNSIISNSTKDGERSRGDVVWQQIFNTSGDKTVYTDIIQAKQYVICIGISNTIWSERKRYDVDGGDEGEQRWDYIYRDTWLIQTIEQTETDDDNNDNDDDDSDSIF